MLGLLRKASDEEHKGTKPIIEGYLLKLPRKGPSSDSEWKTRWFVLYPDAQLVYYTKRGGVLRGRIVLDSDFFCADHRLHPNGFQVSDLNETYYLAAADHDTKMFWMHTIAGVIRRLSKDESLPPQYQEVAMQHVQAPPSQSIDLSSSRVAIYEQPTPPSAGSSTLQDKEAQVVQPTSSPHELDNGKETLKRQLTQAHDQIRDLQTELVATKTALREAEARTALLEAQSAEDRKQELTRAARATEDTMRSRLDAELHRAKDNMRNRYEAEMHRVKADLAHATKEKDALSAEVQELRHQQQLQQLEMQQLQIQLARQQQQPQQPQQPQQQQQQQQAPPARQAERPQPSRPQASAAPASTPAPTTAAPSMAAPAKTMPLPESGIKNLASLWDQRASGADQQNKNNPFSKHFDPSTKAELKPGDDGYGRPPPGSQSEARAQRAKEWVDAEIDKLLAVIAEIGEVDAQGRRTVKFKPLFVAYETISDTLVGILMRAKKRGFVVYEGDMLFQGLHDAVLITCQRRT